MVKIKDIIRQKFGWKISYRDIAKNLNISVSTVADYVERARKTDIAYWPLPDNMSETDLKYKLFGTPTERDDTTVDWEWVHKELKRKHVTRQLLKMLFRKLPNV